MQNLQWWILGLGGFGVLVLGVIGLAYLQNARLKRRLVLRARELLRVHPRDLAQRQLAEEFPDLSRDQIQAILELGDHQVKIDQALEQLQQGVSEEEIQTQLQAAGLNKEKAEEVVGSASFTRFCVNRPVLSMSLGIVLPLLGLAALAGGILLWMGNRSGRFVTFPFAGQLTMIVGVMLLGLGSKLFLRTFLP